MKRAYLVYIAVVVVLIGFIVCPYARPVRDYVHDRFVGSNESRPNEIVIWHPWGGTQKELLETVAKRFESAHPGVHVRLVFTSNTLSNSQKFFTSVAARKSPDVIFVDGPQVAEWACQGALQSLDTYITKSGIRPTDFFTPCWNQCRYDNRVWALTYCADPNFGFAWNRDVFRKAGLDPNKPPVTIADMDRLTDRITKKEDGILKSIGIIPWAQFGSANSMFTWGWAFGGSFYDEKDHKITANNPRNVKALEWMISYGKKYDVTKIMGMAQGFGALDKNPFYIGQLGMACMHITQIQDAKTYAPKLDYGLGEIPYPPGGEPHSSWVGGWCIALPRMSKHPDLGWEFMRWVCADPVGTTVVGETQNLFPGYKRSPFFAKVKGRPGYGRFLEIMAQCKHNRPVMPAQAYYMGALERAVDFALYGQKTPKQALDDATVETQRELDLKLAGK